jgi:hypothetical protein
MIALKSSETCGFADAQHREARDVLSQAHLWDGIRARNLPSGANATAGRS